MILAQQFANLSIDQWAIAIIVIVGFIAAIIVIVRQLSVQILAFINTICWILRAAVVGVLAVKFLIGMF